jgi:ribosomal protein S18 acetylase RimI-like enzyme
MDEYEVRRMDEAELGRIAEIDRTEQVRVGYAVEAGRLVSKAVHWDVGNFLAEGEGEHTVAEKIAFCREHLDRGGRMIGAFCKGRLAGVAVITPEVRPGLWQLAFLHTSRAHRRKGVASRLVTELTALAEKAGARAVYVSASPTEAAVGFYQSLGFALTDAPLPELLELEPEDIHMVRELGPPS